MKRAILAGCIMAMLVHSSVVMVEAVQLHTLEAMAQRLESPSRVRRHRPTDCAIFYQNDSLAWQKCMGVEPR